MKGLSLATLLLCGIVACTVGKDLRSAYKSGLQHAVRSLVRALPFAQGNTQRDVDHAGKEKLHQKIRDYIPGVNGGGGGYGGGYGGSSNGGGLWDNDWPMKKRLIRLPQKKRAEKPVTGSDDQDVGKRDKLDIIGGGFDGHRRSQPQEVGKRDPTTIIGGGFDWDIEPQPNRNRNQSMRSW